jgi:hypothetical protein
VETYIAEVMREKRGDVRRAEWLVRATVLFCVAYALIGAQDRSHENFPVFAWHLFSQIPEPEKSDYSLRLLETNGRPRTPPVYFEDARLVTGGQAAQAYVAMYQLAVNIRRENAMAAAILRKQIEASYFSEFTSVHYQVVRRTFDIKERRKCDCFLKEEVIADYRTTSPGSE